MDEEAKKYPIVTKVEKNVNLNSLCQIVLVLGELMQTLVFEKVYNL